MKSYPEKVKSSLEIFYEFTFGLTLLNQLRVATPPIDWILYSTPFQGCMKFTDAVKLGYLRQLKGEC